MTATDTSLATVTEVTREVLETMFFAEAEPVACRHGACIAARVRFTGEQLTGRTGGELMVMLSRDLARSASAGFLAEEVDQVTEEQVSQVSCELANIICGAILSRLYPHARVALGSPELTPPDFDSAVSQCAHQCFETPEGMLAVTIRMSSRDE
jgi:CheY-specific phosphatase CheX